ncbi:MAG: hypothetical protein NTV36_02470 [Candidatus Staskawiczbacteria bacterium]|nr:hypothetical protein [Candidatus Staskawiczbacteria bacterium]
MGIAVEFNPDLALRNISEFKNNKRKIEECIQEPLEEGKVYDFLKKEQRLYWLNGELPLIETKGDGVLSDPIASIVILEVTHFKENGEIFTKGKYKVIKIIPNGEIYFNGHGLVKK